MFFNVLVHEPMAHMHHHCSSMAMGLAAMDPFALVGFIAVLSYSFFASLHCIAMCAPLVGARLGDRAKLKRTGIWLYNVGRLCGYVGAGSLFGALASSLAALSGWIGMALSGTLGGILIVSAIYIAASGRIWHLPLGARLATLAGVILKPVQTLPLALRDFALGFVTVLLPCMSLTPALSAAAASASSVKGAAIMFAFYCGTLPVMVFAPSVPNGLIGIAPKRLARFLAAFFLFAAGVITILRMFH